MAQFKALNTPPGGAERGGVEIARIGIVDNDLRMSLIRGFDEPAKWGMLAAELLKQVSQMYAMETKHSRESAAKAMVEAFAQAMGADAPGDAPSIAKR
jgi:uncharacterized protein DUF5076